MGLKAYHQKRNFKRTKEPRGKKISRKETKHLYVIQKHAASHLHYDFRIELDGVLLSWAVPKGPSLDPKVKHLAVHVEDHPIEYAHFEGIIPQGEYGGGTVMVWDIGKWESLDKNVHQAYHKGNLTFNLYGKKLHGRWKLIRLKQSSGPKEQWLLFKVKDEYSRAEQDYDITKNEPDSVLTDRAMNQIGNDKKRVWTRKGEVKPAPTKTKRLALNLNKKKDVRRIRIPFEISPELATLVAQPPKGDNWLHEIKWDGYRIITKIQAKEIQLLTRHHNNWTHQFPSIHKALKSLKLKDCILDGEVVALARNGKANFQILQNMMEDSKARAEVIYYLFDILYYDSYDLRHLPLIQRKEILQKILNNISLPDSIKFNDHIIGDGDSIYQQACTYGLEGIVSKKITSQYIERRTKDWLKIKCSHRQEFVIGGYCETKSSRQYFRSLLLGYYQDGKLIYCGKVGTGFTQQTLAEIAQKLEKYQQNTNPFDDMPIRVSKDMHWVKPKLVAEVEYLEMTSDGVLRHPSFKGLREDKKAKSVKLELASDAQEVQMARGKSKIKFTNLDRILYPGDGFTKQDLVTYYESVSEWILPYITRRPITIVRCPSGYKNCFYQKHVNETVALGINSIEILEHGGYEPYITINDINGLLGFVQMGVLEIHPWGSRNNNLEKPDWLIFDLDPAPDVSWDSVIECAYLMREFLDFLKLNSFLKTTGGKGLHIVIPIRPHLLWDDAKTFTKRIADIMVELYPEKYIATMSKAKRKGKIFIDYVRNSRGATAIAPYSTRAKADAPIAVPIAWEELSEGIKSDSFNLSNINERLKHLKKDPWQDFFKTKQTITVKMQKLLSDKFS